MIRTVRKRDGRLEDFDPQKLLHWMEWAEVVGVDWPPIMMEVYKSTGENTTSKELHQAMINAFLGLKTEEGDKMAGRLYIGSCYKKCFGDIDNIPTLSEFYNEMVHLGYWEDMGYTEDELNRYNLFIDHDKDLDYSYTQLQQIVEKYSAQDRTNGTKFETPQFTFMRMALGLGKGEKDFQQKEKDIWWWYNSFAINQTINAPTPNYVNLGTHNKGYASCVLFTCADDASSLAIGDFIANKMTCASAGIGHHAFIRCEKDPIRGGIVSHKGKINYFKSLAASINANTQSSRGGSATTHAFCLDPDTEEMIRMRHPTTVPKKRVPELDFSMGHVKEFRKRAALNQDWPQITYYGNEDLYHSAYRSNEEFEEKLFELESSGKKFKKVNARKLLLKYLAAAQETGRKYHHNIDEINRHTPFKEPIYQSNLC